MRNSRMFTRYIAYASHLREAMHVALVNFKFVDGGAGAMTRGDMLDQAGSKPPVMVLPVFPETRRAASKRTARILNAFAPRAS